MNNRYQIDIGQFYITNVCNLTCDRCITYNNRKFKGHFLWKDHQDHYTEWSKKLDITSITIIGGEPFANPDLINWVDGINALWSTCNDRSVCTNGTYLSKNIELSKEIVRKGFWLDLCVHDPMHYDEVNDAIHKIIKDCFGVKVQPQLKINNNRWASEVSNEFIINDRLVAKISKLYNFASISTKYIKDSVTYMHNSDPFDAHKNCGAKYCHYFVRGNLYKCFLTAIGQDLISQFKIEDRAIEILNNYKSSSPWDTNHDDFFESLQNAIPQCTLCPSKPNLRPIWPLSVKKEDL
jgi:sulfatase maturation enzyme AslB (radical SAM superfamily)